MCNMIWLFYSFLICLCVFHSCSKISKRKNRKFISRFHGSNSFQFPFSVLCSKKHHQMSHEWDRGTACKCLPWLRPQLQYIPRNMHTVFALPCFVVVIHWLIFPYPSGLLHWHCGNLTIAPVPAKQPWWIWINISCEFIMNDCITTTKQSTTKPWDILYVVWYMFCTWCGSMVVHHHCDDDWVHVQKFP